MNHHAAPQVTPAKTQPFMAPNPEQPRTAQVIPPNAINRIVGRIKSCARSRWTLPGLAVRSERTWEVGWVRGTGAELVMGSGLTLTISTTWRKP